MPIWSTSAFGCSVMPATPPRWGRDYTTATPSSGGMKDQHVRSKVGWPVPDHTRRSTVLSTIGVAIAAGELMLLGSRLPLEVDALGISLGTLVIGSLIYCLALVY